ncbi:mitochondrial carrier protein [Ditylenchus destructor]|nr:mitochondrial carrier protein [Ditylenchus destructor]
MDSPLPQSTLPNGSASVRQRKGVSGIVQEFDAFLKVSDDVKEAPKAINGVLSLICFSVIILFLCGLLYDFFTNSELQYTYSVDTDFEEKLDLEIDMIVATPCNNLAIMPMGVDQSDSDNKERLKKNPSRFEMTPEEEKLWTVLKRVHKEQFKPGTPLKAINEITYMQDDVEKGLLSAAEEKQKIEMKELEQQRKELQGKGQEAEPEASFFLMVGNGMGVFQIISAGAGSDEAEGTACRVNGKVPVLKGNGDRLTISVGKSLNIGNIVAHVGGSKSHANISHRIERFHFGPHVWGLVTPLAGAEQITNSTGTEYRYYVKVVPTKIYNRIPFSRPATRYQYSVTYAVKQAKEGEHMHDSIIFDYEFTSIVIEVRPAKDMTWLQLMLRMCSLIGGIYATSSFIEAIAYIPKIINGGFAGIVGVSCVFPIDLVKTRLQNQRVSPDGKVQYKGIVDCARQTWQNGGRTAFSKFRSLYSGSAVNIVLITPEKAIKLVANDFFRAQLATPGEKKLSTIRGMIAGGCAGFCQVIITTPMELLKIQLQQGSGTKQSALKIATHLFREKGIAGLYRGIRPTIARDVTFSVVYFPLFAQLDSLGPRKSDGSGDAVFYASFLSGIIAGAVGSFTVTPLDVIKTRIQLIGGNPTEKYKGVTDAFIKILKNEGPKALFKGAACRMMVMAPLFGIAQTVYYVGVAEYCMGMRKVQHV